MIQFNGKIKKSSIKLALLVAIGAGILLPTTSYALKTYVMSHAPADEVTITGCVIRFDRSTPRIHANSAHYCRGIEKVSVNSRGELVLDMTTWNPVLSLSISSDETLASRGIMCGGSGGSGVVRVRCSDRDGLIRADGPEMKGPYSNLWVTVINTSKRF